MNTTRIFVRAATLLLMACTTACGVLPKQENIQVFAPQAKVTPDPAWPKVSWQLAVARPSANKMLDSSHIIVSPTPDMLQVYHAASWTDVVPDLLQTTIAEAFEDSGKIGAIARQATSVRADFVLLLDIRHFEAVYADPKSPPNALIEVGAKLLDTNGHVVDARTFRQSAPATGIAVASVTHAFDTALAALTSELVGWTLNTGQQAKAAARSSTK